MPLAEIQALLADRSAANVQAAFARLRTSMEVATTEIKSRVLERVTGIEPV